MPGEMRLSDSDVVQDQPGTPASPSPPSEGELFREALDSPTLKDFENFKAPIEEPVKPESQTERQRDDQGRFRKQEAPQEQPEARIPSGRLREESEARRRAEQEISELRARIAAYEVNRSQPQAPPKKIDIFDDPAAFVRQEMTPYLQQMEERHRLTLERQSTENAQRFYGAETVDSAYNALRSGMGNSDPQAWAVYHSAMGSHDPYGVITRWFVDRQTIGEIGGDLQAYKQRIREEALKDPEFQRQVFQVARGQAMTQINRPVPTVQQTTPPSSSFPPSVSEIGATGGEDFINEASDQALFRAAVSAKRRPTIPGR